MYWLKALRFYKAKKITTPRYISNLVKQVYKSTRESYIQQERTAKENKDENSLRYLRDPKIDRINLAR